MKTYLFFFTLLFIMACSNTKTAQNSPSGVGGVELDKQGHRGCRGLMPENTIPAMLNALDLRVTTLEMDAVITKDKKIVLSHEPFFNHEITTKPDGNYVTENEEKSLNIYKMTYEEVKKFDVGMKPHPRFPDQQKMKVSKPLLSDVIDTVMQYIVKGKKPMPFLNIETKSQPFSDNLYHPGPEEFVDLLMGVIKDKKIEAYVIIQSFDFRTLQYLHKKYPDIKTAALIEDYDKRSLEQHVITLGFVPTVYSPSYLLVNEKLVEDCHAKKMKIIPWTVNDKAKIEQLKKMGVDGIITDYPNLFNE